MDQSLPRLDIGDLLLVPGMGAYTSASATFFNGFAPTRTAVIEEIIGTKPHQLDSFAFLPIQEQERARTKKTEVTYSSKHLVANIGV
jgi:hypothetical protein